MLRIVIVGGGAAGTSCAQAISAGVKRAADTPGPASDTHVIVIDPRENPVELPPLSKSVAAAHLNRVELHAGDGSQRVVDRVHRIARATTYGPGTTPDNPRYTVEGENATYPAHIVVLATGVTPRTPPLATTDVLTVFNETSAELAHDRIAALAPGSSVGVLGSGFLALEIARGLADAGHHPHVYLRGARPIPQVGAPLVDVLTVIHAQAGVTFVPNTPNPDPAAHDLWFAAVGATPTGPELPEPAGAAPYLVNPDLSVPGLPGIYAIGDCARITSGPMAGISAAEAAALSSGRWLGERLVGNDLGDKKSDHDAREQTWVDVPWHWSFEGPVRVFTAGDHLRNTVGDPVLVGRADAGARSKAQWLYFDAAERLTRVETLNNPGGHNAAKKVLAGANLPTRAEVTDSFDMRAWATR